MATADGEGFVEFFGEAAELYDRLNDISGIVEFWELMLDLAQNPKVDFERIFEYPLEDDLLKIVYGPPWTVVFKNSPSGRLMVYLIRHPSL
jgi:hypothetical protein